ncbi:hypothetical protein SDJN03_08199, partial [Cucurbita argyrosperma subsp. sororia]
VIQSNANRRLQHNPAKFFSPHLSPNGQHAQRHSFTKLVSVFRFLDLPFNPHDGSDQIRNPRSIALLIRTSISCYHPKQHRLVRRFPLGLQNLTEPTRLHFSFRSYFDGRNALNSNTSCWNFSGDSRRWIWVVGCKGPAAVPARRCDCTELIYRRVTGTAVLIGAAAGKGFGIRRWVFDRHLACRKASNCYGPLSSASSPNAAHHHTNFHQNRPFSQFGTICRAEPFLLVTLPFILLLHPPSFPLSNLFTSTNSPNAAPPSQKPQPGAGVSTIHTLTPTKESSKSSPITSLRTIPPWRRRIRLRLRREITY